MLASSSRGNCGVISDEELSLLIDAGISAKRITSGLESIGCDIDKIKAVFITHEHSDHISGLEVLSKKLRVPIFVPAASAEDIAFLCPSAAPLLTPIMPYDSVRLGSFTVTAYPTPHDSHGSVGYRFDHESGVSLGYATDIGHITKQVISIVEGCRYVVVESNHDIPMLENGPYSRALKNRILGQNGHLANQSITKMLPYLVKNGTYRIVLAHLSQENNTPSTAYDSAMNAMIEYGLTPDRDFSLEVAKPAEIVCICKSDR